MKSCFQLMCFISLYFMVTSTGCRDGFIRCTYKFPKNWHKTLRMESGWNETSIRAICKHRFELKYCTNTLHTVCTDRHSTTFANGLYERLAYLCDEGREAFRDATACLNDRAYQLQCKSCYAMGRFYHEGLSEEERCALLTERWKELPKDWMPEYNLTFISLYQDIELKLALRYVGCFRNAAENFCNKKARKFIEKYNWIAASYFVGCGRDWLSITLSDQASTTSGYFKTVLTAFALGYSLQRLLVATPGKGDMKSR